ncbi:MAG: YggS family pyridoxal phosphate-dependent enzyme [Actinobacteria bacterium]|nr:YggS family pyridoxal phosphate-dependent enzyme [Actinomycetota bacterium]
MSEGSERIRQRAIGERLVAVTKGFPVSTVTEAVNAGLTLIGENRAQELLAKATEVQPREWHFVGRIQRNKVRSLAPLVAVWHSVDRIEVAEAIADEAQGARVHVQVNVAGEAQKGGCRPTEAAGLVARCHALGLRVVGLMTVPPIEGDPQPHFAALARLAADAGIAGLSMGMSGDFEVAVEEGSTVVRLGSILFGPRPR